MLQVIKDILFEVTGKTNITYDTDFIKDLQLNSFDIVNVVCAFEERYHIKVPTRDVWQLRTVKDVIEYMATLGFV